VEAVRDNAVSDDVTITSSLRSGMIIADYETASTFVEVMQKKPWPLFFPDTV